jgi:hypothetical protein
MKTRKKDKKMPLKLTVLLEDAWEKLEDQQEQR